MRVWRLTVVVVLLIMAAPAVADDILDAMDQARKSYEAGDLGNAKQQLDLASQLIAQKNAEGFAALLPAPLPGWKAEDAQAQAAGMAVLGASQASRVYTNEKGEDVEVSITGDSPLIMQFAPMLATPALAASMGKLIRIKDQRAIQTQDGDVTMVVANKFLIQIRGSADAAAKLAYAQAIDTAKLSKL